MNRLIYKLLNLLEPQQVEHYNWSHSDILGFSFE